MDIFLSYSRKDRGADQDAARKDRVSPFVAALEAHGFEVFWDEQVPSGVDWEKWIRQKLSDAKCAVALWSEHSIKSDAVRQEAKIAQKAGKLISVRIDPVDTEELPMGLYSEQALQLVDWSGDDGDERWLKVVDEIEAKLVTQVPLWVQRKLQALETDLAGEQARVKKAEGHAKDIKKTVAKSAEARLEAERDRDAALEEAASLKSQLKESAESHAAIQSGLRQELEDLKRQPKAELEDVKQQLKSAETGLAEIGDKLSRTERDLEAANRELARGGPRVRGGRPLCGPRGIRGPRQLLFAFRGHWQRRLNRFPAAAPSLGSAGRGRSINRGRSLHRRRNHAPGTKTAARRT